MQSRCNARLSLLMSSTQLFSPFNAMQHSSGESIFHLLTMLTFALESLILGGGAKAPGPLMDNRLKSPLPWTTFIFRSWMRLEFHSMRGYQKLQRLEWRKGLPDRRKRLDSQLLLLKLAGEVGEGHSHQHRQGLVGETPE